MNYFLRIACAADQTLNTVLGGEPDETLSSRAYRNRERPGWKQLRQVIDSLFFWQDEHCLGAYLAERERAQMPPELRG